MDKEGALERKLEREKKARQNAEKILEEKAVELFEANRQLIELNADLEEQVKERTLELQESELRFRSLVESAGDIIYNATPFGICTYVNPNVVNILGYTSDELIGQHFTFIVTPDALKEVAAFYLNQFKNLELETYYEFPVLTKKGQRIWIGQRVRLTLTKEKRVKEITAIAREITEKKLAEDFNTTKRGKIPQHY